jgi:hypothetical protein
MADTKQYRLRPNAKFAGREPGDVVELTDEQAEAFADKVDPVDAPSTAGAVPAGAIRGTSHVPQDVGAATKPGGTDANPGNAVAMRPGAALPPKIDGPREVQPPAPKA